MKKYLLPYIGTWIVGVLLIEVYFAILTKKYVWYNDQLEAWVYSFFQTQLILILFCTPVLVFVEQRASFKNRRLVVCATSALIGFLLSVSSSFSVYAKSKTQVCFFNYSMKFLMIHMCFGLCGLFFGYFWSRARANVPPSTPLPSSPEK